MKNPLPTTMNPISVTINSISVTIDFVSIIKINNFGANHFAIKAMKERLYNSGIEILDLQSGNSLDLYLIENYCEIISRR